MSRGERLFWARIGILAAIVALLEILCRTGAIKPLTLIAPSKMVVEIWELGHEGELAEPATQTFLEVSLAFVLSVALGATMGAVVHALPRVRRALDPLLASWYAVPFFVFYPLLVALFGLNILPLVAIGMIFAAPAMMLSTLTGLDRVPRVMHKMARVHRLTRLQEVRRVTFPSAAPHLFTGLKLAFTYSFIGIIAGEFILSGGGLGYGIAYAYESFESPRMYAFMLIVLMISTGINGVLYVWDRKLARRRGLA
jgi:NitT/TauT family transport system permease protein